MPRWLLLAGSNGKSLDSLEAKGAYAAVGIFEADGDYASGPEDAALTAALADLSDGRDLADAAIVTVILLDPAPRSVTVNVRYEPVVDWAPIPPPDA